MQKRGPVQGQRFSRAKGLLVVCLESGSELGRISDLLLTPSGREVAAFLLVPSRGGGGVRVLPFEAVSSFSGFAVSVLTARNAARATSLEKSGPYRDLFERGASVIGSPLRDEGGEVIGSVSDVSFQREGGLLLSLHCRIGGKGGSQAVVPMNMVGLVGPDGARLAAEPIATNDVVKPAGGIADTQQAETAVAARAADEAAPVKAKKPDFAGARKTIEDEVRKLIDAKIPMLKESLRDEFQSLLPGRFDDLLASRGKKLLELQFKRVLIDAFHKYFESGWGKTVRDLQSGIQSLREEMSAAREAGADAGMEERLAAIEGRFEEAEGRMARKVEEDVLSLLEPMEADVRELRAKIGESVLRIDEIGRRLEGAAEGTAMDGLREEWRSFRKPVEFELRAARERLDAVGDALMRFERKAAAEMAAIKSAMGGPGLDDGEREEAFGTAEGNAVAEDVAPKQTE